MTEVLVLGGTGWLSGRIAALWRDAGAAVTCVARGSRPAPEGTALHVADRDAPDAYDALAEREWDEVVDVSSVPEHAAAAVDALAGRARHWTYVSSLSVYAANDVVGADESAPTAEPAQPGDEYDYSRAKAAAEHTVREALPGRAAIVRPGLIVGDGDPTDRFGYWVSRFALAGDGPVLIPGDERRTQVIDVDDLAAFVGRLGARQWVGVVNATGPSTALRDVLHLAREVAGHTGAVVAASDDQLLAHEVSYWMGPRSLPLWLPADMPGFATRSIDVYRREGGLLRPLRETLARTLDDERTRGLARERRAGLTRVDERGIIDALIS
ncbi:NAD-dependent epimerase/dehydratase family protein [Microbacterium hominis]|uniref:NAD-dependent epimerase/dehydratase family protein n=1 Tax=Microbacterium hominis TaxID=162426 RepID=A0A7D4PMR3_9MICO|nr:NAD-dependent epimerase/dehydratase family protein [Microbacterium hominis]QKJ19775.1 NAD-dependent epimerase/dehydratase family protein [Microbacterium hominis]